MPGGNSGARKIPSALVVRLDLVPIAVLVTTTCAPGTTALLGSVTRPLMVPRVSCAQPATENSTNAIKRSEKTRRCMDYPFLEQTVFNPTWSHYGVGLTSERPRKHLWAPVLESKT